MMLGEILTCASKMCSVPFRQRTAIVLCLCAIAVSVAGCGGGKLPDKSSQEYAETVSAFYTGLAALQVGDDVTAESKLAEVTQLVPGEPAGWANWGVLALRQRNYDAAARTDTAGARTCAGQRPDLSDFWDTLESRQGNSSQAIADWRKAVQSIRKTIAQRTSLRKKWSAGGAEQRSGVSDS